jgi:hypothetical protein
LRSNFIPHRNRTLPPTQNVTAENYEEASEAVRDILMMYVDMAHATEGFGHSSDVHIRFDPLKFVNAQDDGKAFYVDMDLLRAGSAVAIACVFYDLWCEEQHLSGPHVKAFDDALADGRLRAFPEVERLVREAIEWDYVVIEDDRFEEAVLPIYRKYVLGFFQELAHADRSVNLLQSNSKTAASEGVPDIEVHSAMLKVLEGTKVQVSNATELLEKLGKLDALVAGQCAVLERSASDYIKATREGDFWSVVAKGEAMWTIRSFTADMTTEYFERRLREKRQAGSLIRQVLHSFRSPPPERALSTQQVRTLFVEYLLRRKFSIPQSGA